MHLMNAHTLLPSHLCLRTEHGDVNGVRLDPDSPLTGDQGALATPVSITLEAAKRALVSLHVHLAVL